MHIYRPVSSSGNTALGLAPLCPIKALVTMLADLSLFQVCKPAGQVLLNDSVARKYLSSVSHMLSLPKVQTPASSNCNKSCLSSGQVSNQRPDR